MVKVLATVSNPSVGPGGSLAYWVTTCSSDGQMFGFSVAVDPNALNQATDLRTKIVSATKAHSGLSAILDTEVHIVGL